VFFFFFLDIMGIIFIIISFLFVNYVQSETVHVTVYYESLCPYSRAFIREQLHPAFEPLADYIDVLFLPFGKSIIENNGESFWCQHGNDECVGNMVQSCGLYALAGNAIGKANFINCQMELDVDATGQTCAEANGINYETDIRRCIEGGLGTLLQIEAERLTHKHRKPYPEYVPTVVFNNTFDQDLNNRSKVDFFGLICELIDGVAPACQSDRK